MSKPPGNEAPQQWGKGSFEERGRPRHGMDGPRGGPGPFGGRERVPRNRVYPSSPPNEHRDRGYSIDRDRMRDERMDPRPFHRNSAAAPRGRPIHHPSERDVQRIPPRRCPRCELWNESPSDRCERCECVLPPSRDRAMPPGDRRPRPRWDRGRDADRRDSHVRRLIVCRRCDMSNELGIDKCKRCDTKLELPIGGPEPPREWPPCFDTFGSEFTFDARSGMFYEAESDFFYDPKSKLYFGNKKGVYYKFDETMTPPFREVANPSSKDESGVDLDKGITEVYQKSQKIAINLKTTKLSKKRALKGEDGDKQPASKAQKKDISNITKWNVKEKEKKEEMLLESIASTTTTTGLETKGEKVPLTVKGEPICIVCRRKFPTIEKLRVHEQLSTLHKENLAKKGGPKVGVSAGYQDRAEQRRLLHGPTELLATQADVRISSTVSEPDVADTRQDLQEGIGAKLLQKYGGPQESAVHDRIRKDWEAIEELSRAKTGK